MPVDPQILELLVCPESRMPLRAADAETLANLNARIERGELTSKAGEQVKTPLTEALVRSDGACAYRVDDGIPDLLVADQIPLQ